MTLGSSYGSFSNKLRARIGKARRSPLFIFGVLAWLPEVMMSLCIKRRNDFLSFKLLYFCERGLKRLDIMSSLIRSDNSSGISILSGFFASKWLLLFCCGTEEDGSDCSGTLL